MMSVTGLSRHHPVISGTSQFDGLRVPNPRLRMPRRPKPRPDPKSDADAWAFQDHSVADRNLALAPSSMKIIVTYCSSGDQAAAQAAGLSKAGPGASPHNCVDADGNPAARAVDFAVFDPSGNYITRGEDARYAQCGAIAVGLGMVWGGNWTPETDGCAADFDHCEMVDWKSA
jgi:hypothetical protein